MNLNETNKRMHPELLESRMPLSTEHRETTYIFGDVVKTGRTLVRSFHSLTRQSQLCPGRFLEALVEAFCKNGIMVLFTRWRQGNDQNGQYLIS